MTRLLKFLKWSGLTLLTLIVLGTLLYLYADNKADISNDFRETITTGGQLEATYLQKGTFATEKTTIKADKPIGRYTIYYPAEMTDSHKPYPTIFVLNGTGGKASKYEPYFEHLASWGFIVVGTQDKGTGTGKSTQQTLAFLLAENSRADSLFYGKVDETRLGITGFSQGGAGVFNVITDPAYQATFKAAAPMSPVSEKTTREMTDYPYDSALVQIPTLVFAGTEGEFEIETVIPLSELNLLFDKIPGQKVIARRVGMDHDQMMISGAGYVTAWFRWHLQGDDQAKQAFIGETAELTTNNQYQDVKINLAE